MEENEKLKQTDSGHSIIDLHLDCIEDPLALDEELNQLAGVVEHGLFLSMVNTVIVGKETGPEVIENIR